MGSGGLMQLVAYGAQDIYLTGNPQITSTYWRGLKSSWGAQIGISAPSSPLVVPKSLWIDAPQLLVIFNDGNTIKLREHPKVFTTNHTLKNSVGPRTYLGYGKNVNDEDSNIRNGQSAAKF